MPTELLNLLSAKNIIVFIIVITRLSGFFVSAPFFSTYPIPNQIKVWLCATIAFLIYPILIALRIKNEEEVLEKELNGYKEYKKKVKYRIIPFIW